MTNWKNEIQNLTGWSFGDSPEMADELAEQTANGKNLANCFLWKADGALPKIGDRSYVMNSRKEAVCVVEVCEVQSMPFDEVDETFAQAEGYETLAEWQAAHRQFFRRQLSTFDNQTLVVCQRFRLLHVFAINWPT